MRGARTAVLVTAAVSCAATTAIALLPGLAFGYLRPQLHVALETAASLIALLAGFLVYGRFRRRGQVDELVLACALAVLAVANLVPVAVQAGAGRAPGALSVWIELSGRWVGAVLFACAAFAPRRRLRRPAVAVFWAGWLTAGALLACFLAAVATWPAIHDLAPSLPVTPARPDLDAHPALITLQLTAALAYAAAAAGYLAGSRRHRDEFFGWLAIAAALASASHVNYLLYPSFYFQWVYTGDVFRIASYAVLLTGSMREISSYWHALSQAAVAAERRRIARDLHDGVAQEVAYLARNLDSLHGDTAAVLARLRRAAERAQLEARQAISTLAAPTGQSLTATLAAAAGDIAERFRVGLDLDLAEEVRLPQARADALVRIACEAVANAARHSGTSRVGLALERAGSRVMLRVSDSGCGFDATDTGGGYGIVSMRERALSVGGEVRIFSAAGFGSRVEVRM